MWGCLRWPRRETGAESASSHPCGGLFVFPAAGFIFQLGGMEKKNIYIASGLVVLILVAGTMFAAGTQWKVATSSSVSVSASSTPSSPTSDQSNHLTPTTLPANAASTNPCKSGCTLSQLQAMGATPIPSAQASAQSQSASSQLHDPTDSDYAQFVYDKLTMGDITSSAQCDILGKNLDNDYISEDLYAQSTFGSAQAENMGLIEVLVGYTYLYSKHRCIGLARQSILGQHGKGSETRIIDLGIVRNSSSAAYIADCTTDSSLHPPKCSDIFGNVYDISDITRPLIIQMYGMLDTVYFDLQELGQR